MKNKSNLGFIEVIRPGMGCSVQDKGRFGFYSEGIPQAGVMDTSLSGIANELLQNTADAAVIEFKSIPPKLVFSIDTTIVIAAFDVEVFLNENLVKAFSAILIQPNDELELKIQQIGGYGYIAVKGGIQTDKILGSRSFFEHITSHSMLEKGMKLPILKSQNPFFNNLNCNLCPKKKISDIVELSAHKAPEFDLLTTEQQYAITKKLFSIDYQSNRMGYLLNEPFYSHNNSIISAPVLPGTVQWTPSGKLIILMKDAQTMGGYPRILQLDEAAMTSLAGVAPNGFVKFNFFVNS